MITRTPMANLSAIRFPADLHAHVSQQAIRDRMSFSTYVRVALQEKIDRATVPFRTL